MFRRAGYRSHAELSNDFQTYCYCYCGSRWLVSLSHTGQSFSRHLDCCPGPWCIELTQEFGKTHFLEQLQTVSFTSSARSIGMKLKYVMLPRAREDKGQGLRECLGGFFTSWCFFTSGRTLSKIPWTKGKDPHQQGYIKWCSPPQT